MPRQELPVGATVDHPEGGPAHPAPERADDVRTNGHRTGEHHVPFLAQHRCTSHRVIHISMFMFYRWMGWRECWQIAKECVEIRILALLYCAQYRNVYSNKNVLVCI